MVINTGTIGTVDAALTTLKQSGESLVASAIQELTEAVALSESVTNEVKAELLEILSFLATEATAPKERRRSTVAKNLLVDLSTIVAGIASLAQLWQQWGPTLLGFFR